MKKITVFTAALICAALLSACGKNSPDNSSETSASPPSTASVTENAPSSETVPITDEMGEITAPTVTDVENEVDRAIYKVQVTLPDGWQMLQNTSQGKFYACPNGTLMVKAQNFGEGAELTELDKFADGVAAGIKMTTMFYQTETTFGEPEHVTVAGEPAVKYDYIVDCFMFDDEGNKQSLTKFKDELYVFYKDFNSYMLVFEAPEESYDAAKPDFDKLVESFTINDDGTEGYAAASEFMSVQESLSEAAE